MIEYHDKQGTPEWFAARRGVITASRAKDVRRTDGLTAQQRAYVNAIQAGHGEAAALKAGGYKKTPTSETVAKVLAGEQTLEFGEAAHTYAKELARERCGGYEPEGFQGLAQRMGHEEEQFAAIEYTARTGLLVESCGFICTDDRKFGMSLDRRVVGHNGALEIKTMVSSSTLWTALVGGDINDYIDQCLVGHWLLSLDWVDLCLWAPDLSNMVVHRITRDEEAIQALEDDMVAFEALVCEYEAKLRKALGLEAGAPALSITAPAAAPAPAVKTEATTTSSTALPDSIFG